MSNNKLPARHIGGEAFRNILASPWLFASGMLITLFIMYGAIAADLAVIGGVQVKERDYIAAGGDILIAKPASGGSIKALQCDSLHDLPGVYAAVGVRYLPQVGVVGRPEANQNVMAVSWQIHDLLAIPVAQTPLTVIAQPVAERWTLVPGSWLHLAHQELPNDPLQVTAVADLARLGDSYSTAVLVGNAMLDTVDECLIGVSLSYKQQVAAVVPALLGETSQFPVSVAEVASMGRFGQAASEEFLLRATGEVGMLAGIAIGLFWAMTSFARAGRTALYRSLGVKYREVYAMRMIEQAIPMGVGITNGAASTIFLHHGEIISGHTVLDIVVRHSVAALLMALVVIACATLIQPQTLKALKQR